jgi:CTP synthase
MKYIVVTGGVLSGLGKGITASSIGRLLKSCGFKVTGIKIDPYLNCDAGTMSPFQHGEVFVLTDGGEVDLDLGNYERFLDVDLTKDHNITTGKVYKSVIEKERRGDYLGSTVQIIPHITNEIRNTIKAVAKRSGADIAIIELGGTVGDIESMPFLEAVRQLHIEVGHENLLFVHTTLVPVMGVVGEQKTKPTQHSVKELRAIGILPDIIVGRSKEPLAEDIKRKISMFCDVPVKAVISAPDAKNIYEVPLIIKEQNISEFILKKLNLNAGHRDLDLWKGFVKRLVSPKTTVNIGLVGKYVDLKDSYFSVTESLYHAGAKEDCGVNIVWIEAEDIEKGNPEASYQEARKQLADVHGVVVPGGFGERGTDGKVYAIEYVRKEGIPFIGLCLGFQLSVVEFCRNVLGLEKAHSVEFDQDTPYPVIDILPEQLGIKAMGGTMRLGDQRVFIDEGSLAEKIYGSREIFERHRHRYEVNPEYISRIEEGGLKFTGKDEEGIRMEICELPDHPYFIASQFHPEFKSRPMRPTPMFHNLIKHAMVRKQEQND